MLQVYLGSNTLVLSDLLIGISTGPLCTFFADANPLFALIPEQTSQSLRNSYVIIVYGTISNVNGGAQNDLHVLRAS